MNRLMSCVIALLLAALLALAPLAWAEASSCVETDVTVIKKYGNLVLSISGEDLLSQGYAYGDMLAVTIAGQTLEMPLGTSYSDVENGEMICRVEEAANEGRGEVSLAINMGDLTTALGIAEKATIEEEPGFRWDLAEAYRDGISVAIEMKEKGGYADQYMIHQLVRSDVRADYPDLTDAQYANFRAITTTGMGRNALYRSSSPVNPKYNRNLEADAAANAAGIRTVMNLADSAEAMRTFEGYDSSYYSGLDVIPLNLGVDFTAPDFRDGIVKGFRFLAAHDAPCLVHCGEGKDRGGFTAALLECLMGATADEVIADYMVTYFNFFGVRPGTEQYDAIVRSNIQKSLATAFGVQDLQSADLAACAEAWLLDGGMTGEEIAGLKAKLGTDIEG